MHGGVLLPGAPPVLPCTAVTQPPPGTGTCGAKRPATIKSLPGGVNPVFQTTACAIRAQSGDISTFLVSVSTLNKTIYKNKLLSIKIK